MAIPLTLVLSTKDQLVGIESIEFSKEEQTMNYTFSFENYETGDTENSTLKIYSPSVLRSFENMVNKDFCVVIIDSYPSDEEEAKKNEMSICKYREDHSED